MDLSHLRMLTQSSDEKLLKDNTTALTATLKALQNPANDGARWGAFMVGMCAACTIEGWVAFDLESESREPCMSLIEEFLSFCSRAYLGGWFSHDASLEHMVVSILTLEAQRLAQDGWPAETHEHSYIFRYREYAFLGADESTRIFPLPVTPEG